MKKHTPLLALTCALSFQLACIRTAQQVPEDVYTKLDLTVDKQVADLPGLVVRSLDDPVHKGQIRWLEAGTARAGDPPLLLVHGLGSAGMRDFYPLLHKLTQSRRVLLLDLPGFARSSKANLRYSPATYTALLAWLIKTEAGGRVDLLGHSMGAATLLELAGRHPQLVRRLVLIDAATILHSEAMVVSFLPQAMTATFRPLLESFSNLNPDMAPWLETAESRKQKLKADPNYIAALSFILHNFSPALSGIQAPTLILWGGKDNVAPVRNGHLLNSRISNSKLVILDGLEHSPQLEDPQRVLKEVLAHLEGKSADDKSADSGWRDTAWRTARQVGKEGVVLEGDYKRIEIINCGKVLLKRVRALSILIESSDVEMLDPTVVSSSGSPGPAVIVRDSKFIVTGGRFEGQPALRLENTTADLAGLRLRSSQAPAWEADDSRILFSVTEVREGDAVVHLHEERY